MKQPEGKREILKKITVRNINVSEEGKVNGYVPKAVRGQVGFDELMKESDSVEGTIEICFKKDK